MVLTIALTIYFIALVVVILWDPSHLADNYSKHSNGSESNG